MEFWEHYLPVAYTVYIASSVGCDGRGCIFQIDKQEMPSDPPSAAYTGLLNVSTGSGRTSPSTNDSTSTRPVHPVQPTVQNSYHQQGGSYTQPHLYSRTSDLPGNVTLLLIRYGILLLKSNTWWTGRFLPVRDGVPGETLPVRDGVSGEVLTCHGGCIRGGSYL